MQQAQGGHGGAAALEQAPLSSRRRGCRQPALPYRLQLCSRPCSSRRCFSAQSSRSLSIAARSRAPSASCSSAICQLGARAGEADSEQDPAWCAARVRDSRMAHTLLLLLPAPAPQGPRAPTGTSPCPAPQAPPGPHLNLPHGLRPAAAARIPQRPPIVSLIKVWVQLQRLRGGAERWWITAAGGQSAAHQACAPSPLRRPRRPRTASQASTASSQRRSCSSAAARLDQLNLEEGSSWVARR